MIIAFDVRRREGPSPFGPSTWGTSSGSQFCLWAFGNDGNARYVVSRHMRTRRFAGSSNGWAWFARLPFLWPCGLSRAKRILALSAGYSESSSRQEQFCFSLSCFVLRRAQPCERDWRRLNPPRTRSAHSAQRLWLRALEPGGRAQTAKR